MCLVQLLLLKPPSSRVTGYKNSRHTTRNNGTENSIALKKNDMAVNRARNEYLEKVHIMLCLFEGITIGTLKSERDSIVPSSSFPSLFFLQNLESRGSSHHFNCGNPTLGQLAYHYMAVKFKRINSSLIGKRLFVSLSKSLDPNRAPSLKLAMENPKWTEGKTSICMSEYSMYIT
ncbi:hypothetical protein YC2023_043566 [Brassica napus]